MLQQRIARRAARVWVAVAGAACAPSATPAPSPPAASLAPAAPSVGAPAAPPAPAPSPVVSSSAAQAASIVVEPCGPFECFWADDGPDALAIVLADQPLALGIGEAHALAGSESIPSTTRRFSAALLPELRGRASHLVVELLAPDPRCDATAREVRRVQEPVTAPQAKTNAGDYVELGRRARELDIEPFVLSPTCDELGAIAAAGEGALDQMLGTIARVTSRMLRAALVRNRENARTALVIGYGGALHNDIAPSPQKAAWSYGPELAAFTGGRYTELDLIVREFIKDSDVWRALPWYAFFDPGRDPQRWLVMRTGPRRYALFFPASEPLGLP
jgi:hypothetical protein